MRFRNREDAARLLAERLSTYRGRHALVLGIPRGAVPMAKIIAEALDGDLDVVLVHKLRAPFQPELAVGAVDEAGRVYRPDTAVHVDPGDLAREIDVQREQLSRRRLLYTRARGPISAEAREVIIVDDGIATGSSVVAAIRAVRAQRPRKVVVATAVAPPDSLRRVSEEADEVVCLHAPDLFFAVGEFFDDFSPVTDDTVVALLRQASAQPATA